MRASDVVLKTGTPTAARHQPNPVSGIEYPEQPVGHVNNPLNVHETDPCVQERNPEEVVVNVPPEHQDNQNMTEGMRIINIRARHYDDGRPLNKIPDHVYVNIRCDRPP